MFQQELLLKFPLAAIGNLYHFRFETVEPLIDDALQGSSQGFCDYGFCDDTHLCMIAYVNHAEAAAAQLAELLRVQDGISLDGIWISEKGAA